MMRRSALAGLTLAALTVSAPYAFAQTVVDPQVVKVQTRVACGTVTVTLTNDDVGAYGFTFTTGPFDGGPAGDSGRIDVAAGATVTRTVRLPEDSFGGRGFLTLAVAYGPNTHRQPVVDLGLVDTDCETTPPVTSTTAPPASTVTPSASTTATATSPATETTTATSTPPLVDALPPANDIDCADITDAEAAAILAGDPAGPNQLDLDNDGIACEATEDAEFDQVGEVPVGSVATGG